MIPDFSKKTIDVLAKRAAYKCSNPDCRVNTIGPNSDPEKALLIGEAAHINGARVGSKRFDKNMTDISRAEITNSIWLCRNCHKLIDSDETKYTSSVLFNWREKHEEYIILSLGNSTDQMILNEQNSKLEAFRSYPQIITRIIRDKPDGWEWRLTSELMRYFNDPLFRKLQDLKDGLYLKKMVTISSNMAHDWILERLEEMSRLVNPARGLLDRLTKSWGRPGEEGDLNEIHHVTILLRNYLEHIILFEEQIYFASVPYDYQQLTELLKDLIASQVLKFSSIPSDLDDIVSLVVSEEKNKPKMIHKEIVFELPPNWENEFNKELKRVQNRKG